MVRTKITYYKMMTPKRRAEMRAVQARRAACIAAGLPPNSSEEEEREQEWVPEEMEEGEASNEKMEEVEAPRGGRGGGGDEHGGFGMDDTLAQFELAQTEEAVKQHAILESIGESLW